MVSIPKPRKKRGRPRGKPKRLQVVGIPARMFVELGQAMLEQGLIALPPGRRFFMKGDVLELVVEPGRRIKADGIRYNPGRYFMATHNLQTLPNLRRKKRTTRKAA